SAGGRALGGQPAEGRARPALAPRRGRARARRAHARHRRGEQGGDLRARGRARGRTRGPPARGAHGEQLPAGAPRPLRPRGRHAPRPAAAGPAGGRPQRAPADARGHGLGGGGVKVADWLGRVGPFLGLLFVSALFGLLVGPEFFRPANLELVARQTGIVGTAALGMTLVIAAGGIDLSVGSIIALATVVVAQLLRGGQGPSVAALGGVAAGALCGAATGLLVTRLQVIPFIVSLGMMLLVRGAAKGLAEERRLEAPATWLNDLLRTLARGEGMLPWGLWRLAFLALVLAG